MKIVSCFFQTIFNKNASKYCAMAILIIPYITTENVVAEPSIGEPTVILVDGETKASCDCPLPASGSKSKKVKGVSKNSNRAKAKERAANNARMNANSASLAEWTDACDPQAPDNSAPGEKPEEKKVCPAEVTGGKTYVDVCFEFPCKP